MEKEVASLHAAWLKAADNRQKDRMVAAALGLGGADESLPHYSTRLEDAEQAMDRAWILMEELAPVRINCILSQSGPQGSRECHVEWWPADGGHVITPRFATEAESRAFAAYVFAKLLGKV